MGHCSGNEGLGLDIQVSKVWKTSSRSSLSPGPCTCNTYEPKSKLLKGGHIVFRV